ncbi:DUF7289 family protein [Natrinema salsiterrestre]|uniref:Uncharacterized protein n=1 Tax=Natrinema salsiterrestre TaxID=2950540 RepID=A0A9Q4KYL5_9EURY|nr:hypothetical protein [Natrinema salsiterrestre]MDF9746363.1 hypothetical protein [Natrinema salsiterrestre]
MKTTDTLTTGRDSTDTRAVSDVLAFILVFGIILSSVALLSTMGMQAMTDYQENEQLRNAERGMEALTVNFNDVLRYGGIEKRYGELSLREGRASTGPSGTELEISLDDDTKTADLGEFAYTSDGTRIVYEGGGLVRQEESGTWSHVLKRPQLRCGNDTAVVSLVTVSADEGSIQTSGGLGFTMSVENRNSKVYTDQNRVNVSVVDTEYDAAWNSTLESGDWERDGTTGTCEFDDTGRVVVTIVDVDVEY